MDSGQSIATEIVYDEIQRKDDDLREWLDSRKQLFKALDEPQMTMVRKILSDFEGIVEQGKEKTEADVFVIALAHHHSCAVVTEEKANKRNGIPTVCRNYGIECINTVDFMRQLGLRF